MNVEQMQPMTPAESGMEARRAWAQQEVGVLDHAARLGRRPLPEARALARACEVMTRTLVEA